MSRPPRGLPPIPPQDNQSIVDFLLPTGMLITMTCHKNSTLADIKSAVWQEARSQPLFNLMKTQGFYSFVGVTNDGKKEEFVNESHSLDDLDLFTPMLKLVERQGDIEEKKLNAEIGALIGRKLADFDVMDAEIQDCRRHWLNVCEESFMEQQASRDRLVEYNYTAMILNPDELPRTTTQIEPIIYYFGTRGQSQTVSIPFTTDKLAQQLVDYTFAMSEVRRSYSRYKASDFCLKVCGHEEYLVNKTVPLYQYKYIQDCIARNCQPTLCMVPYEELAKIESEKFLRPIHAAANNLDTSYDSAVNNPFLLSRGAIGLDMTQYISTWNIRCSYKIKIISAKNCNVSDTTKIYVRAGLYHGDQSLGALARTMKGASPSKTEWNEELDFDVPVTELPRSAKLCFVVYQQRQLGKRSKEDAPLAWINCNVFNYAGVYLSGRLELHMWPIEDDHALQDEVNYIGSTVLNPNHSDTIVLNVEIPAVPSPNSTIPVMFPSAQEVEMFAREMAQGASPVSQFSHEEIVKLQQLVELDPLSELDESDKEMVWKMRNVCMERFPDSLPRVLQCVTWSNRSDVAQIYLLLRHWQPLHPEKALELLHFQYADIAVRQWAVNCLTSLSNNKLYMYLLQLVQALKFEPYLDCPLSVFLLRRGLQNRIVGHHMFWHLRAEMHVSAVSVRYGLMLEAYCRGCGQYRTSLASQVEAMTKWKHLTGELQKQKKAKEIDLKDYLTPNFVRAMQELRSPLNPASCFKELRTKDCKVMDSKMKPLWLSFNNSDNLGEVILHIFKNGDDLRQDMLTLQVMSIMDNLWKESGLDLKMCPYACLSMGDEIGLIDIVRNSTTIAKIQKKQAGARGAFDKRLLYSWLKSKNKTPNELNAAVENFTLSCAGCCVATYVLGIGDRHSDNILLRDNGQLVHIDFGHFLGNFKSKFGVKRERVPFVLTDDFIHIITREGGKNDYEFVKFKKLCERAFMMLRLKGDLFINLFTLMLSTGIPELRSVDDVRYISNALGLSKPDDQALEDFRKKFQEAVKHSWSVSINWYLHNVARAGN